MVFVSKPKMKISVLKGAFLGENLKTRFQEEVFVSLEKIRPLPGLRSFKKTGQELCNERNYVPRAVLFSPAK
jgi:hypothetical protein